MASPLSFPPPMAHSWSSLQAASIVVFPVSPVTVTETFAELLFPRPMAAELLPATAVIVPPEISMVVLPVFL